MVQSPDRTVLTAAAGTLLAMLSFTAPLVTVQQTAAGLGAGASGQTWMLSSMSLGLTVAMLTVGTAGDDFGRRRVFVGGAALLAIASVAGAVAPTTLVFVLARVVAGVGAAAVLACSLALIGHAVPPGHARVRAMGLWSAGMGAGLALGPFVAAWCADGFSWRLTYWIGAALTAVLAIAGRAVLPESTSGRSRRVDVPGVLLLAAGLASLLAGLTEGRGGWARPHVLVMLVVGVVVLAGFGCLEWRSSAPMIDLSLFRRPALLSATAVSFANGVGITAGMSFLPTVLQRGLGESSLVASVFLLVWSVTSVAASMGARLLGARVAPAVRMAAGLVCTAAGLLALAALANQAALVAGLFLAGVGTGLVNATIGGEAVASVPPHRAGMGSGINNTSRYLGAALGVTVVFVLSVHSGQGSLLSGWALSAVVCAAVSLAGAFSAVSLRTKEPVGAGVS